MSGDEIGRENRTLAVGEDRVRVVEFCVVQQPSVRSPY